MTDRGGVTDPCAGLFGRVFGHRFNTVVITRTPPAPDRLLAHIEKDTTSTAAYWDAEELIAVIESLTANTYGLACSRCGISAWPTL